MPATGHGGGACARLETKVLSLTGEALRRPMVGKERPHLERWNRRARYSLVVTIETPQVDVDLYTPIATQIGVPVEAVIER